MEWWKCQVQEKTIIILLDQCNFTAMIWAEGQEKFIEKLIFSKIKTSCKAAIKCL